MRCLPAAQVQSICSSAAGRHRGHVPADEAAAAAAHAALVLQPQAGGAAVVMGRAGRVEPLCCAPADETPQELGLPCTALSKQLGWEQRWQQMQATMQLRSAMQRAAWQFTLPAGRRPTHH